MPATQPSTTATNASARPYPVQTKWRSRNPVASSSRLPAQPRVTINEELTADHPLVRAYLARKLKEFLLAEEAHCSDPANAAWHAQDLFYMMPWWRHELAGRITDYSVEMKMTMPQRKKHKKKAVKQVEQPCMGWTNGWPEDEDEEAVAEDLAEQAWKEKMLEMSWGDVLSDIATHHGVRGWDAKELFAIAALSVAERPSQDVHWALWSKNSKYVTAQMVEEVVEHLRKVPDRRTKLPLDWTCKSNGIAMVNTYQEHRLPRLPHPSTKRPTRAAARKETRDTEASRKRVAEDEGADQATKRRKTQGEASVPLRTSQRLRKSAGVPPVETVKEATEVVEEFVEAELEVDVDVEMMEDNEPEQAKAPVDVVPQTKKAARRKRAWGPKKRTKRSTAVKTKATPKDTVQEAEVPAASPQTAATVPTSTFTLPPLIIGDAENAPSPTAVGSPESAESATRVGTPMEPSNKPVETKLAEIVAAKFEGIAVAPAAKVPVRAPAAKVPVRASARIREKKTGAGSARA